MSKKHTFSACPFCGNTKSIKLISVAELAFLEESDLQVKGVEPSFAVICDASNLRGMKGCGAHSGFMPMKDDAAALWNRRGAEVLAAQAVEAKSINLREVGLSRDTKGMCIVTVNGREAIRDNGDVISHFATLDWFAARSVEADPEAMRRDAERWQHAKRCVRIGAFGGFIIFPEMPIKFQGAEASSFERDIDAVISSNAKGDA